MRTVHVLIRSSRPSTGLYAFLLTLLGFKAFAWSNLGVGILSAVLFALITMSIMSFNDLIDAENDRRKNKLFASNHKHILFWYWLCGVVIICFLISFLFMESADLALFCSFIWLIGLWYSFIPHWYIAQNAIVAFCSGSPVFCAMIYHGSLSEFVVMTFVLFSAVIWQNECYKDAQDVCSDHGYKRTLHTELGWLSSWLCLVGSLHVVSATLFWHPNQSLQILAITLIVKLAMDQVHARDDAQYVVQTLSTMRHLIYSIGLVLYVS